MTGQWKVKDQVLSGRWCCFLRFGGWRGGWWAMGAVVQSHREEGLASPSGVRWHLGCRCGQRALKSPTFTLTPKNECRQSSVAGRQRVAAEGPVR